MFTLGFLTTFYFGGGKVGQGYCSSTVPLPVEQFSHRFLQHTLPKGFVKVRYYGLFSSGNRQRLAQVRRLLDVALPAAQTSHSEAQTQPHPYLCPTCGQHKILLARLKSSSRSPPVLLPADGVAVEAT